MSSTKYWRVILIPDWGVWETCRDNEIIAIGYRDSPDDINVQRFRGEMKLDDKVVAYLKDWRIGALGTITGEYSINEVILHGDFWRTRKVQWNHKSLYGWDISDALNDEVKEALIQRPTVVELTRSQYEEIKRLILSW